MLLKFSQSFLLLVLSFWEIFARTSPDLKVTLPHGGVLIGRHLISHSGRGIRAFLGIPYAEPPVNELRFQVLEIKFECLTGVLAGEELTFFTSDTSTFSSIYSAHCGTWADIKALLNPMNIKSLSKSTAAVFFQPPVPASAWNGETLAIKDSPICIQRDPFRRDFQIDGSEDCLYLNVYAPQNPNVTGPLPVMIFFHGGGWECGSGISAFYGPEFLLDHDVVYVSGNFRLGPLGFLSTETPDCPGNNGLKDQVEMLRWIQKNIASFGGDPGSVTIFGESAGGASVTYHMMSDMSKGLFHKGISQSGTYFNPWAQPAHKGVAVGRAKRLAELLKCNQENNDWPKTLDCLRTKPAESIMGAIYDFFEWDYDPMIPFPPVVEPNIPGAFITRHPRDEKSPHGLPVPWMAGITSEEGALKTAPLLNIPGLLEDFNANFDRVLPITLYYDHHTPEVRDRITRKIDQFYFGGKHDWSKQNHQNLTNLFTDAWFLSGLEEYLRVRLESSNRNRAGPTYLYLFDHKGEASFTEIFQGGSEHFYGVCHAEELQYLFPVGQALFVSALPSQRDNAMREAMVEMWVNFARHGKPITSEEDTAWKPVRDYPLSYVRIGCQQTDNNWKMFNIERNFFEDRVQFWRELNAHKQSETFRDEL